MYTDALLNCLRAAGEPSRLRMLALCSQGELTVTELVQILGQSQPRVSRHLKLLVDAGLLDRHREGTWAFYRPAASGGGAEMVRILSSLISAEDAVLANDLERLAEVKRSRQERADAYFRANAAVWQEIRSLYVPEEDVEAAVLRLMRRPMIGEFLDIGTGTGRLLELFAGQAVRCMGIDLSHEMLAIARARMEELELRNCQVRHADMYRLPFPSASFDLISMWKCTSSL